MRQGYASLNVQKELNKGHSDGHGNLNWEIA